MKLILLFLAILNISCGMVEWTFDRFQCGLKCPKYKSCQAEPGGGGVFVSGSGCYPKREFICRDEIRNPKENIIIPALTCECWNVKDRLDGIWVECPKVKKS